MRNVAVFWPHLGPTPPGMVRTGYGHCAQLCICVYAQQVCIAHLIFAHVCNGKRKPRKFWESPLCYAVQGGGLSTRTKLGLGKISLCRYAMDMSTKCTAFRKSCRRRICTPGPRSIPSNVHSLPGPFSPSVVDEFQVVILCIAATTTLIEHENCSSIAHLCKWNFNFHPMLMCSLRRCA